MENFFIVRAAELATRKLERTKRRGMTGLEEEPEERRGVGEGERRERGDDTMRDVPTWTTSSRTSVERVSSCRSAPCGGACTSWRRPAAVRIRADSHSGW